MLRFHGKSLKDHKISKIPKGNKNNDEWEHFPGADPGFPRGRCQSQKGGRSILFSKIIVKTAQK